MSRNRRNLVLRILSAAMKVPAVYRAGALMGTAADRRLAERALDAAQQLASRNGYHVMYGPFAGLAYPEMGLHSLEFARKLLGTYESELHETFERIRHRPYEMVVDVGAAEGYYAVGLARMFHAAQVYAYEADDARRSICTAMARMNGVQDRVILRGFCTLQDLKDLLVPVRKGLVLADIPENETELLRPEKLPCLRFYDVLLELHDFSDTGPTVSQVINSRFCSSHRVEIINARPGKPAKHLDLSGLDIAVARQLLHEPRQYSVGWAFLEAKQMEPAASAD